MGRRKTVSRTPAYGDAVLWLACNDETAEHTAEVIASFTTTLLAADLFGVEPLALAVDIVRARHGAGRWRVPATCECSCSRKKEEAS